MGRAMAHALIGQGVCAASEIMVIDPEPVMLERVRKMGCLTATKLTDDISEAPVVVLAVKPQVADDVIKPLKPLLNSWQVVVSIMAGISMEKLEKGLGHKVLVRVMPNTPAQVGLGMNVYFAAHEVSAKQLAPVVEMLSASGETLRVSVEDGIDAATAISGSGPAYVYYLAEHWTAAARSLGFSQEDASLLIQQTLIGATALWRDSGEEPRELRERVTSKGGTTEAALKHLDQNKTGKLIVEALEKAYARAKELGR